MSWNKKDEQDDELYSAGGFVALSKEFLLQRGYCCGNGCVNCPYDYKAVPEPRRSRLLEQRKQKDTDAS